MADEQPDERDFTNRYNTPLAPQQEAQFQGWVSDQSKQTGRNIGNDLYDYDLRGWWQKNPGVDLSDAHLTDNWKKPNHPTFSTQSQYHGVDGMQGGQWEELEPPSATNPQGKYNFTPGKTNMFSGNELNDYFGKVEPGNKVILPGS